MPERSQYIRSLFSNGLEILVDARTNLPVGYTRGGVDEYFARLNADGTSLVSGDGNWSLPIVLEDADGAAAATANAVALQALIDSVGPSGVVRIEPNLGTVEINTTIYHDNIIDVGAGTTIKLRDSSTCSMFRNKGWNPTRTTATSMTASGRVGTITFSATPEALTVGKTVSVLGATNAGYNGCHVITGRSATTLTVRLPRTPAAGTATGTVTCSPVDEMIGLTGKGAIDYNEANQSADGTMNTIQVVWANVGQCFVGEGLQVLNAKKFNFLIAGYRYADVDNLHAETASDIIHFLGPGTETVCTRITGKSGDDSLAFTIGDVSWFNISRGDFFSIRVDQLNCDSEQALIRISGNSGWKFYDIELANLFGSSAASPVTIADFSAELQGLDFDHIKICGVNCETATAVPVVAVSTLTAGGGDRLDVDVTQLASNAAALQINASTTTVRSIQLRVANPVDGCTKGALEVVNATVNSARVEGLRVAYGSSVFAVWVSGGTLNELMVSDCEVGGSGSRVVAQQGTMGRVFLNNVRQSSGYCTFEQNASANTSVTLMANNCYANSVTSFARWTKTGNLLTSNVRIPSGGMSGSFNDIGTGATVTWKGDIDLTGASDAASGVGTQTKTASAVV